MDCLKARAGCSDNSEPKIGGLVVFSYTFTDEGVTLQEHVRSECQFEQRLAVYLGGSMVAVRYMHVGHWTLLVHDWLEQTGPKSICIKTTIACHVSKYALPILTLCLTFSLSFSPQTIWMFLFSRQGISYSVGYRPPL